MIGSSIGSSKEPLTGENQSREELRESVTVNVENMKRQD